MCIAEAIWPNSVGAFIVVKALFIGTRAAVRSPAMKPKGPMARK